MKNNDDYRLNFLNELLKRGDPNAVNEFTRMAENSARLNKNKTKNDDTPLLQKMLYWTLGIILILVIVTPMIAFLTAYSVFSYGYVAVKLWAWFIMPIFNVGALKLLQAAGILLLVRLFTYVPKIEDDPKIASGLKFWAKFVIGLAVPWATLLTGYIIHRLM